MRSAWQCLVGRDFQLGDMWGDGDDDNPGTFDVGLEAAESDKVMTNPERRESEDETKEECVAATVTQMLEDKPLVLLQVNCRSIYNKNLDFRNLTHISLML